MLSRFIFKREQELWWFRLMQWCFFYQTVNKTTLCTYITVIHEPATFSSYNITKYLRSPITWGVTLVLSITSSVKQIRFLIRWRWVRDNICKCGRHLQLLFILYLSLELMTLLVDRHKVNLKLFCRSINFNEDVFEANPTKMLPAPHLLEFAVFLNFPVVLMFCIHPSKMTVRQSLNSSWVQLPWKYE